MNQPENEQAEKAKPKKRSRTFLSILLIITTVFFILAGSLYAVFRSSRVQTILTKQIAAYLSSYLNTNITVRGVDIAFPNKVILEGLYVEDLHQNTLLRLEKLSAGLTHFSAEEHSIILSKITLVQPEFNLKHYKGEEDINLQFIIDALASKDTMPDTSKSAPWNLDFEALELTDGTFSMTDFRKPPHKPGFDYSDIEVKNITIIADEISIKGDTIRANIEQLSANEKSGFVLHRLKGNAAVCSRFVQVKDGELTTPNSDVAFDLAFTYDRWHNWIDFVDSVNIAATLKQGTLNVYDIGYFAHPLYKMDVPIQVQGTIKGPVSNLKVKNLKVDYANNTKIYGNFHISGLPDIDQTFFTLKFNQLSSSYADLVQIPIPTKEPGEFQRIPLPDIVKELGIASYKGEFTGYFYDFVSIGSFSSDMGNLKTNISMKELTEPSKTKFNGMVSTENFQLGKLTGNPKLLGGISANASVNGVGLTLDAMDAHMEGVVKKVEFNNYTYTETTFKGDFSHKVFKGNIVAADPNLKMSFSGLVNLYDSLPGFNFHTDLVYADLTKLNLFMIDSSIKVSAIADVNFTGTNIDNILGNLNINALKYIQNSDTVLVSFIKANLEENGNVKNIRLRSDIADADFTGHFKFVDIPQAINHLLIDYLPRFAGEFKTLKEPLDISASVTLKDLRLLETMFVPALHLEKTATIKASLNTETSKVNLIARLPQLNLGKKYFENIEINGLNSGKALDVTVGVNRFVFGDSVWVERINLKSFTRNDTMDFALGWYNTDLVRNSGNIRGKWAFARDHIIRFALRDSEIYLADSLWAINPDCRIAIDSNAVSISKLIFQSRMQQLVVDGKISEDPAEKLSLSVQSFELSNLNPLTKNAGITLGGIINGRAELFNAYKDAAVTANMLASTLSVNNEVVGDATINSQYDNGLKSVQLGAGIKRDNKQVLSLSGFYYVDRKQNALDFKLLLNDLALKIAEPFAKGIISKLGGTLSGDVAITGSFEKPITDGKIKLNNARLTIDYLNTSYALSDEIRLTPKALEFSNISLYDSRNNEAKLSGKVVHNYFQSVDFDLNLVANKFMALNTTAMQNDMYFGKAFVTGLLRMSGDPKNIVFKATMKSEKGTQFNIPLGGTGEVGSADFVKFVSKKDTLKPVKFRRATQVNNTGIAVNLDLEVTPDAEVKIIFDEKVGDVITGRGSGNLQLGVNTKGTFQMLGEYTLESGSYLFTLQNLVNKLFVVEKGGTIKWSGNPYDADINLTANYVTKTSVYELLQDENYRSGSYKTECKMYMTGKLMNPGLGFDIALPNSPPDVQQKVAEHIPNEDKNKQVFGLLVLNRFFTPSNTSSSQTATTTPQGSTAGSSLANSTSELISSQLSNMLSQISKDFDVGVKYRPGDQLSSQELEVMFSTQIFNNRISVEGALGYIQGNAAGSQTNILGDVNVEYKMTNDGRLRAKAFNRTNDVSVITANSAPYTQGIGLTLRREFDTLGGLFSGFLSKTKPKK